MDDRPTPLRQLRCFGAEATIGELDAVPVGIGDLLTCASRSSRTSQPCAGALPHRSDGRESASVKPRENTGFPITSGIVIPLSDLNFPVRTSSLMKILCKQMQVGELASASFSLWRSSRVIAHVRQLSHDQSAECR